jgi:tetratricopeptide (TPR) repeat protein
MPQAPTRSVATRRVAQIAATLVLLLLAASAAYGSAPQAAPAAVGKGAAPAAAGAGGGAADAALAKGDATWARRAEGHVGAHASPAPIGEAIAAYQEALKAQPERLEVYWKLLRALHFRGEYVAGTREQKQAVFGPARTVAEAGLDRLARRVGGRERLDAMAPQAAAKALAGIAEAAPLYLWAGIHWGLWGDNFGRLAAARQGVGDRLRRYSEIVIAIDERFEYASGHRLLGRLHTLAPKVPFITGWVDRDKAVAELRRAVALAPDYPLNAVFLAEALLMYQPAHAAEARQLLRRVVERTPGPDRPEGEVEGEDAVAKAKALLAKYPG